MKKVFTGIFTVLFLSITASPAYAADMQIKVESVTIAYDVKPEIKNNRTMVPLRVISEVLGAKVNWSGSEITIAKSDMQVTLKLKSNAAVKNGKTVLFDVKPYIKNNHTMVPLRFIAETFGCNVSYSNFAVTVETNPLVIDGVKVKALQQEYYMTMGEIVSQINGNAYNEAIYDIFVKNKGEKVEAPSNYSMDIHTLVNPGDYYKAVQYDFLDLEGNSIKRFDVYSLAILTDADPEVVIYEANEKEWYMFNCTAIQHILQLINTASKYGFLMEISNTAP